VLLVKGTDVSEKSAVNIIRYFYLLLLLVVVMTQGPLGPLVHFCLIRQCQSQNTAEFAAILIKKVK
jgi:hypothetical protein